MQSSHFELDECVLTAIDRFLSRLSTTAIFNLSVAIVVLIGLADYRVGYVISLSVLYLAPVAIASWYGSQMTGMLISGLAAVFTAYPEFALDSSREHSFIGAWEGAVGFLFFLISSNLLVKLRSKLHLEHQLARTDPLTGILNSRAFLDHMIYIIALSHRDGAPLTLAYIDLDNFKQVNDRFGHSEGDRLLQSVGQTLQDSIRRTDVVARLGGDEFALLLPVTNEEAARILIGKIKLKLDKTLTNCPQEVACSIGSVSFLQPPSTPDEAVRMADLAMYKAKRLGKNRIHFETVESTESHPQG